MKIRKYREDLLEGATIITEISVKIASGTDTGIFSYQINGAREFGERVINGIHPVMALQILLILIPNRRRIPILSSYSLFLTIYQRISVAIAL